MLDNPVKFSNHSILRVSNGFDKDIVSLHSPLSQKVKSPSKYNVSEIRP